MAPQPSNADRCKINELQRSLNFLLTLLVLDFSTNPLSGTYRYVSEFIE
jgi:hypothetical protein